MLDRRREARRGTWAQLVIGCLVASAAWTAPAHGRACSGPFYSGPDTIPRPDSVNVPVNALIQVAVDEGTADTLDVELAMGGAAGTVLTLTRHAMRPYFVGAPVVPLAANALYEVRVARATYCSWLPLAHIASDCFPDALDDGPVVLTSFRTSDVVDLMSPTVGQGQAVFTFSELVRIEDGLCAGSPQGTFVSVYADDTGWVASDDGGIAGYFLVRDGEQGNVLAPTPFPTRAMRCSGELGEVGVPGTYQVVAMDYVGNLSMLSAASTVLDGCPASGGCAVGPAATQSPTLPTLVALAGVAFVLRRRRRG